jgi:hypothetical protein
MAAHGRGRLVPYRRMILGWGVLVCTGCAGGAKTQLSAAATLDQIVVVLEQAIDELHGEVRMADRFRRRQAIDAFVQRVRKDIDDTALTTNHVQQFDQVLDRLHDDAETESRRYNTTRENISTVREIAGGLRRSAVQSMRLDRDVQGFLDQWIDAYTKTAAADQSGEGAQE